MIVESSIADYHHLISFCLYLLLQMYLINTAASENKLIVTRVNNCNKSPANRSTSHHYGETNETNVRFKPLLIL